MCMAKGLVAAALLAVLSPLARADVVAFNGGFETAGFGGATESLGWTPTAAGAPGTLSQRDGSSPRTGGFAQHLVAVGGAAMGADAIITQNSIADGGRPSLQGGTPLSATFGAKLTLGPGGVMFYQLKILNGAGAIVAATGLGVATGSTGGAYQTFSMGPINVPAFGAAPNDVYAAFIEVKASAGAFVGSTADAFIDDVNIVGTLVGVNSGACCTASVCSVSDQGSCGGTYQGNGSTCSPDPCAAPATGACCDGVGGCTVGIQGACAGTYQGNGSVCSPNPCPPAPTGACCAEGGACAVVTQATCGGSYQGNGTTCTPNPCPVDVPVAFNGGFEVAGFGGPTDSFGWNQFAAGAAGSLSQRDGTSPRTGGFAQHLVALGDVGMGADALITQNSIGDGGRPSLQQNTQLSANFSAKLTLGPGGVMFYQLRILNGGGAIVAATGLGVATAGTGGAYQTYSMGPITVPAFGEAPNDVYAAFIEIKTSAGAFVGSSAEGVIDDVNIIGTLAGEQTGACCTANVCTSGTQAACAGTYQGNGTTCTPDPCAVATTGACCCGSHCSITEANACGGAGRAFAGAGSVCSPFSNTTPCCRGDYNKTGVPASVQDIFDFLSGYFSSDTCADTNDSGAVSVQDIFDFLAAYFGGCA